jgi:hypothetical protein
MAANHLYFWLSRYNFSDKQKTQVLLFEISNKFVRFNSKSHIAFVGTSNVSLLHIINEVLQYEIRPLPSLDYFTILLPCWCLDCNEAFLQSHFLASFFIKSAKELFTNFKKQTSICNKSMKWQLELVL